VASSGCAAVAASSSATASPPWPISSGATTLQALGLFNTPRARAALQFMEAFAPILDQSQTFTSALSFTLQTIHAQMVEEALETYRVANVLAKGNKEAELEPFGGAEEDPRPEEREGGGEEEEGRGREVTLTPRRRRRPYRPVSA